MLQPTDNSNSEVSRDNMNEAITLSENNAGTSL
jgi:hypothetical protein